jgi:hypothetical protein
MALWNLTPSSTEDESFADKTVGTVEADQRVGERLVAAKANPGTPKNAPSISKSNRVGPLRQPKRTFIKTLR